MSSASKLLHGGATNTAPSFASLSSLYNYHKFLYKFLIKKLLSLRDVVLTGS